MWTMSVTGSATGTRYMLSSGSVCRVNGTLPGSGAGTPTTYPEAGWYV